MRIRWPIKKAGCEKILAKLLEYPKSRCARDWERKRKESNRMAYAEKKYRWCGATGCKEWAISGTAKAPSTTERQAPRAWRRYSLLPMLETAEKYWETRGTKDIKSDSYTASKIQTIDSEQWESNGNAQGATSVIKRMVSAGRSVKKPANPTKMTSIQFTAPMDISKGKTVTVNLANAGYENVYDCTTWDYYRTEPTYDYVGYFASSYSKETETKTVLAQSGSTAVQNFAFDGMDDVYE